MHEVREFYERVLTVVDMFLRHAKSDLTVEALSKLDPSLKEVAQIMDLLASIITSLVNDGDYDSHNMSSNAQQISLILKQIKSTVENENQARLGELVEELEIITRVPVPT